ncbi:helix-turn-helix domain-containing protein [Mucilaginibacter sp. UR6-11]|uniref:helix-turn-helix domain-containing protein n=1 Tax=Mucilaginibacter sp. UR6-11 TaxID=1435644 RepID=UPI001E552AD7|nr:helix-turn-helix transcriptional regulator [Mucilaginibacter sp. UR6-11]MCC8424991.1 helix-turn-helix transcriptional regulator [Mucilaginibacter sp. UR6-11]
MSNKIASKIKAIAAVIRKKREQKNYTQEYLAYKLDISQNAYSKIELGYTKITVERLFQIADVLEVNPTELLDADQDEAEFKLLRTGTD